MLTCKVIRISTDRSTKYAVSLSRMIIKISTIALASENYIESISLNVISYQPLVDTLRNLRQ